MLSVAVAIAGIGGLVRGITGFGGAMVMSPPLALLLGPRLTVAVVLVLESIVAAQMLVRTQRLVSWRVIGPILLSACAAVPLGTLILVTVDPALIRRAIAVTVIVFSLALLRGWRHAGRHRLIGSLGLGALSGTMLGATSVGAPPVILYLLSGPDPVATTRANLTLYVTVTSLVAIVLLWYHSVLDAQAGWTSLWLAPAYYGGLLAGVRLFPRFSDTRFRQLTLLVLICVSAGILIGSFRLGTAP